MKESYRAQAYYYILAYCVTIFRKIVLIISMMRDNNFPPSPINDVFIIFRINIQMWFILIVVHKHKQCTNFKLSKQSYNAHKCLGVFFSIILISGFVFFKLSLTIFLKITCIYVFLYTADWLYPPIQIALVCNGSSLHAQVDIRSTGNASNVINDADDDFLISQIISQDMLATVWVCFDPHPIPRRKQGEHSVRMLIIQ